MITGLPPYQPPIEQDLRCICGRLYLVSSNGDRTERAARMRAATLGARFIDAREVPFLNCECGVFLDFTTEETARVM
jgi:hypothetical protein